MESNFYLVIFVHFIYNLIKPDLAKIELFTFNFKTENLVKFCERKLLFLLSV